MSKRVYQINLCEAFGGSDVYTRFLSLALQNLGWQSTILVNAKAEHWRELDLGKAHLVPVNNGRELLRMLPSRDALVFSHSPIDGFLGDALAKRHRYVGFAHQPLYLKAVSPFRRFRLVLGVSEYVLASARAAGLTCYARPLYGVADVDRVERRPLQPLVRSNEYAVDRTSLRGRALSLLQPVTSALRAPEIYHRRRGLTLGIVSPIVEMKQFPKLFAILAPIIGRHPEVHLEVFGAGNPSTVNALKHSLAPLGDRVRFWGQQTDMRSVYGGIDFLFTGLPEREGLGRNVVEAQMCGAAVLAIHSPPFTETVLHGKTGYLYRDPREDQGADFERQLSGLREGADLPDPLKHPEHLARFTLPAFTLEVSRLLNNLDHLVPTGHHEFTPWYRAPHTVTQTLQGI